MTTLLDVRNLKTYFINKKSSLPAVDGIDLNIKEGETVALVGESGCGKSMTSLSIMRLVPTPNGKIIDGEVTFDGVDLLNLSENEMCKIRGQDISMIFQDPMTSLNPVLTVGDQLTEVLTYHQKLTKHQAREGAIEALELVGFSDPEKILLEYPHRLSGGMRQRVMIAMAMACEPELLIADEPTTALDVTIQAQILELMKKLNEKKNTAILLITHDLGVVAEMCDRVIVMYAGQVVEQGTVREVLKDPQHPYTKGLIRSLPILDEKSQTLYSIPGTVPMPKMGRVGCRFAPRCEYAFDICFKKSPTLYTIEGNRLSRCFLHDDELEGDAVKNDKATIRS